MTTYYVDVEGGNDGNSGLSFALRKKTLTSASTAAANGDTIRVMKSPDPTSLGINGTWTSGSGTVTLASALTANVEMCESGWTPSANVTTTYTAAAAKEGTNGLVLTVAAGFTTGLAAYKTISSTDFSGYQQLSFWFKQTAGTLNLATDITIKLCSDTAGVTAVNSFAVPAIKMLNVWGCFTVDNAAALGSAIQSIAIYLNADQGAVTFNFDNFIACKASSAADSLSLRSLISKNTGTEPWIPIRSINGTTVKLDAATRCVAADTSIVYAGTTETVTTWKRETVRPVLATSLTDGTFGGSLACSATKTISGGWDTTAMSSQTAGDVTFLDGTTSNGYGIGLSAGPWVVTGLSFARFNQACIHQSGIGQTVTARDIVGSDTSGISGSGNWYSNTVTVTNLSFNSGVASTNGAYNANNSLYGNAITITNCDSNFGHGLIYPANSTAQAGGGYTCRDIVTVTNARRNGASALCVQSVMDSTITIGTIVLGNVTNASFGILLGAGLTNAASWVLGNTPVNNTIAVTSTTVSTIDANFMRCYGGYKNTINLSGSSIGSDGLAPLAFSRGAQCKVIGGAITGTTAPVYDACDVTFVGTSFVTAPAAGDPNAFSARVICHDYGGTAGDHRIFTPQGTISTATDQRHTASGYSWKFVTTAVITNTSYPLELPIASVACAAAALVTCSIWVRRDNTASFGKLLCRGGQIAGVAANVSTSTTGSANTWEQISITFTPTVAGVIDIVFQAGTTDAVIRSIWADDFEVTQA